MAFSIRNILQQGLKSFPYSGLNSGYGTNYQDPYGSFGNALAGSQYDYRAEAGPAWDNSIIMACVNWATRSFHEADLQVQTLAAEGWSEVPDHPALHLLKNPNKDYGQSVMWAGLIASIMLGGNSYTYMDLDGFGVPRGLFFMPYFQTNPRWDDRGQDYITDYAFRANSQVYSFKPRNVLHVRQGLDMVNYRKGASPLQPVLREVCTDNEASTAACAVMRNLGMPGLSFVPEPLADGSDLTPDQKTKLRDMAREKFTGDRRGEFFIAPVPGKLESFGFSPEQLVFDKIRRLPEERITACYGIPAVVVGLGAGLERSTFANFKEAREAAYESFMSPLWTSVAEQLTNQLLTAFGEDPNTTRFHFDTKNVKALAENTDDIHGRVREDYKAGIITLEEAREILHYQKRNENLGKGQFYQQPSAVQTESPSIS